MITLSASARLPSRAADRPAANPWYEAQGCRLCSCRVARPRRRQAWLAQRQQGRRPKRQIHRPRRSDQSPPPLAQGPTPPAPSAAWTRRRRPQLRLTAQTTPLRPLIFTGTASRSSTASALVTLAMATASIRAGTYCSKGGMEFETVP